MFADSYPRDEHGWILFPRDQTYRKENLVGWKEGGLEGDHPAKANLFLTMELVRYTTDPGDRIADITAGSGSILLAAKEGRSVVAIDIAPHLTRWMELSAQRIIKDKQDFDDMLGQGDRPSPEFMILTGDCRDYLPMPIDSIIFSPPYAGAMVKGAGILKREQVAEDRGEFRSGMVGASIDLYLYGGKTNLGNLSNFLYNKAMEDIYSRCYDSLPSGGKLSLLIKDRIRKGVRVHLGLDAVRMMGKVGFEVFEWCQWKPPGSMFTKIHQSWGDEVVEDEHIIIMEKP